MKNTLLTFILATFTILASTAAPIDKKNALKIAQDFYQELNEVKSKRTRNLKQAINLQLDYICQDASPNNFRSKTNANALYYVFNTENNQGFVIVSGDDKAGKVLAYSTKGNFSHNDMPYSQKFLMDSYKEAIKTIIDSGEESASISARLQTSNSYPAEVLPLLEKEGIEWDQVPPFNSQCPIVDSTENIRAPRAGCVPVAISQVMRYHRHPQIGKGKKKYTTKTLNIEVEADFENVTYDWEKMLPKYETGKFTEEQGDEVAKFIFHVGASIGANYKLATTSASTSNAKQALVKHFGYRKSMQLLTRTKYSLDEWYTIIKKELNENRPILHMGSSPRFGHTFVCDGYDKDNLFHINWGWGGAHNGHYDLALLHPRIGSLYGYYQKILIGIQPDTEETQPIVNHYLLSYEKLELPSDSLIDRSKNFDITMINVENLSGLDYSGTTLKVVFESKEHGSHTLIEQIKSEFINKHKFEPEKKYLLKGLKLPSETPNGLYELSVLAKNPQSGEYTKLIAKNEHFKNFKVEVSNEYIEFKHKKLSPKLELVGDTIYIDKGMFKEEETNLFTLNLKNSGTRTFNAKIALQLKNQQKDTILDHNVLRIEVGKRKQLIFYGNTDSLPPGDYTLNLLCNNRNESDKGSKLNTLVKSQKFKILEQTGTTGIFTSTINKQKALKMYQTNSTLEIELPENSQTLYVFDILGRVIDKKDIRNQSSTVYDVSKMRNSLYLFVVEGTFGQKVSKVYIN